MNDSDRLQVELDELRKKTEELAVQNQNYQNVVMGLQAQLNDEKNLSKEMRRTLIPAIQECIRWHVHHPNGNVIWANIPKDIQDKENEARFQAEIKRRQEAEAKGEIPKKP